MKLTENFFLHEFDCSDGSPVPDHLMINVMDLAEQLQLIRDYINEPLHINSGYRTKEYNDSLPNASPNSQHLLAKAADLRAETVEPEQLYRIITAMIHAGKLKQGGVGLYKTFVHYDIRGKKARW